jgi:uncharacterized lipoprotein YddW (UPF0748 family)
MFHINNNNTLKRVISFILTFTLLLLTPAGVSKAEETKTAAKEFNAVWISYLEFNDRLKDPKTGKLGFTKERFESLINEMFDNTVKLKMNAVVVHVRPFGDAMYPSEYFPWSKYISGEQGKNPGFDPLKYMVKAAHDRGLEFHAWINPYRVTNNSTDVLTLSKDNTARKWLTNKSKNDDRNILAFGKALYFNPSKIWVQAQIRDGIKEIVENYDVDGIHFDDYFYPTLGTNYQKNFDYLEYKEYYDWCVENKVKTKTIAQWRRDNVNRLVKKVYNEIKEIDESVQFGISPGGFLDYLLMDDRYYSDITTWMSKPGYIDYICPQLYWSFDHSRYPYDKTLDRWIALKKNPDIKLYVGIANYKAGSKEDNAWYKDADLLRKMIEYGRSTGEVDGFVYFRYDYFFKAVTQKGISRMLELL